MNDQIAEVPVRTLEQAREFFLYADCSHMHMQREYPERYEEYQQLHISGQMEMEWRKQRFDEMYAAIMDHPDPQELWTLHAGLYDLYEDLKSEEELTKMLAVTKSLLERVPAEDRVIVAETINGRGRRQDRTGLIYMAYDCGDRAAAREFAQLSLQFSSYEEQNKWKFWDNKKERYQRSTRLCREIMQELGLG